MVRAAVIALLLAGGVVLAASPSTGGGNELAVLKERIDKLEVRVTRQEDTEAVRKLAFTYGYYMDNALYDQVKTLFSPRIESCEVSGYGKFLGLDGCKKFWGTVMGAGYGGDKSQLLFGHLIRHYLIKDVITFNADGTAEGRFDYLGMGATFQHPEKLHQQIGVYRMHFVKEDGVWKIGRFNLTFDAIDFDWGPWSSDPHVRCPNPKVPADAPGTPYHPFPETQVVGFNYPNPVTGKAVVAPDGAQKYWVGNWPGEFGGPCGKRGEAK